MMRSFYVTLLEMVRDRKSLQEMADEVGKSTHTVVYHIHKLEDQKFVRQLRKGAHRARSLTPKGRKALRHPERYRIE